MGWAEPSKDTHSENVTTAEVVTKYNSIIGFIALKNNCAI